MPSALIFQAERLTAELLHSYISNARPGTTCETVRLIADARAAVSRKNFDIILAGLEAADGDVLDWLAEWGLRRHSASRVVVITPHARQHVLDFLAALPVDAVIDSSTAGLDEVEQALRCVLSGQRYLSNGVVKIMVETCLCRTSVLRRLTMREQLVLAAIGRGSTIPQVASQLGRACTTIVDVCASLHRKLGTKRESDLVRAAFRYGYVYSTSQGIVSSGLCTRLREHTSRSSKPRRTPAGS